MMKKIIVKTFLPVVVVMLMAMGCVQKEKTPNAGAQTVEKSVTQQSKEKQGVDGTQGEGDGKIVKLTMAMFQSKVMDMETGKFKGSRPAIVDFYATWCGPCKRMAPVLEELATQYAGKLDIYKVDVDEEKELASQLGVQSIPTFLFLPMKDESYIRVGMIIKQELEEIIQQQLLK